MRLKLRSERGQALILVVAGAVALVALAGLALDGGAAFLDRRQAQTAADTAALTAALYKARENPNWQAQGYSIAAVNGYASGVTIHNPPISGYYAGNPEYIQVIIVSSIPTRLGRVLGVMELTNRVSAVARAIPEVLAPPGGNNAIVALAPHECSAVKFQGTATTDLVGGGIFVNSDCQPSAFFNGSNAADMTAPYLKVVGGITYKPPAIHVPTILTGVPQQPYPPIFPMPNPTCAGDGVVTGTTASPGNYYGNVFPPDNTITLLEPGVYCLYTTTFSINAGTVITGHDVTFALFSGDLSWNGAATIAFDAPDEGPNKGLLIYAPMDNPAVISINGTSTSTFTGTILGPSSDCRINGTGDPNGLHSQVVCYTVDLSGESNTNIVYNANEQWTTTYPPVIQLSE